MSGSGAQSRPLGLVRRGGVTHPGTLFPSLATRGHPLLGHWALAAHHGVELLPVDYPEVVVAGPNIMIEGHHQRFSASWAISFCSDVPFAMAIMIS